MTRVLTLFISLVFAISCASTYDKEIKSDLAIDSMTSKEKYPLTVGIVETEKLVNTSLHYSVSEVVHHNVQIYPGVVNLVYSTFSNLFQRVEIIKRGTDPDKTNFDLLVYLTITGEGDFVKQDRKKPSLKLTITGKSPKISEEVFKVIDSKTLSSKASTGLVVAQVTFSILTVFTTLPLWEDIVQSDLSDQIVLETEKNLSKMVKKAGEGLLENSSLKKYAALKGKTKLVKRESLSPPSVKIDNKNFSSSPTNFSNKALIIANNQYEDSKGAWHSLKTPINDAQKLAQVLQNNYGYSDVRLIKNATRVKVYEELKNLIATSTPEDNVLIFYAGHGHYDNITETGYWVPTDAQGRSEATYVANSVIRDRIAQLSRKTKHVLLISDSCFSGNFLTRGIEVVPPENKPGYFNKKHKDKSCQVLTSGSHEYVGDQYRNTGHSPFAYFLLRKLQNNTEKYFSASELSVHMARTVSNSVGQTPKHGILKTSEDEGGEFFFVRADK